MLVWQHLGFGIAPISDSIIPNERCFGTIESVSPSGRFVASDSSLIDHNNPPGSDVLYQLTSIDSGKPTVLRRWQVHQRSWPGLFLLNDSLYTLQEYVNGEQFSVYTTSGQLLYREQMNDMDDLRPISYVQDLNIIFIVQNGSVYRIELSSGLKQKILTIDRGSVLGHAADGFHIAYNHALSGVVIRNLLTDAEKEVISDYPSGVWFSPDGNYVFYPYSFNVAPQLKFVPTSGLP